MAKILIVEDDKDLNKSITSFFSDNEFETINCFNGLDALKQFESNEFDLILSDIMMPILDGFSLVEKIRAKDAKIPIIFMTARDDKFSKQLGYKLGIDDYIVKPFDNAKKLKELEIHTLNKILLKMTNFHFLENLIIR